MEKRDYHRVVDIKPDSEGRERLVTWQVFPSGAIIKTDHMLYSDDCKMAGIRVGTYIEIEQLSKESYLATVLDPNDAKDSKLIEKMSGPLNLVGAAA